MHQITWFHPTRSGTHNHPHYFTVPYIFCRRYITLLYHIYSVEAAQQTGEIASHINEHMKQHENFQKMLSIQKSFDSSAPKILAPGREFLKEGVLKKV
jgi:hypothetical protein